MRITSDGMLDGMIRVPLQTVDRPGISSGQASPTGVPYIEIYGEAAPRGRGVPSVRKREGVGKPEAFRSVLRRSRPLELVDGEWSAARDEALLLRGFWSEADLLALAGGRRHQLSNCRDGGGYSVVVCPHFSFHFNDLYGKLFMLQGGLAQLNEGANDKDAHPHCPFAAPARWPS
jgi:hypothetical protein